ncbi:MAG TPA: VIT1/CCC1 transporter family protein [Chloroflexota bacterium]|nr:VIT1/CCC1 transporter family protein [Chloroflexota bacterium]
MANTPASPAASAAPTSADLKRWRDNLQRERASVALLRALAGRLPGRPQGARLEALAAQEEGQGDYWAARLQAAGAPLPPERPSLRDRALLVAASLVDPCALLPVVAADALRGVDAYRTQADAAPVLESEARVARGLAALAYPNAPAQILEAGLEHRTNVGGSGSLRAAVFGVNDGLTSNLSLVMGVAGAATDNHWILLTGLAGLLAGAFSMGGGEFISMLSQRELFEKELALERRHIATAPEAERANLAQIYREKGLTPQQADTVARQLMADPDVALDTIAREQLGLNPEELGSPRGAAAASFVSFALGAAVPIVPFLFLHGFTAIATSLLVSGLGLFVVGALLSLFTARNPLVSGLRMLGVGLAAATVTYLVGRLIGVSVAG